MAEFEKDYVMRQTKLAVKGLSVFLKDESVDQIMQFDEQQSGQKKEPEEEKQLEQLFNFITKQESTCYQSQRGAFSTNRYPSFG